MARREKERCRAGRLHEETIVVLCGCNAYTHTQTHTNAGTRTHTSITICAHAQQPVARDGFE